MAPQSATGSFEPVGPPVIELGVLRESLGFFIFRANRAIALHWANGDGENLVRPVFYCAFALIGANPGISPAELARLLVLDRSRVSELVDVMDASSFITRRRSAEDQRRQGIYLTPAGSDRLAAIDRLIKEHERRIQNMLSDEERRVLIGLLSRVTALD